MVHVLHTVRDLRLRKTCDFRTRLKEAMLKEIGGCLHSRFLDM